MHLISDTPLRIGMLGLDTSHVTCFARILADPTEPGHVSGARLTIAFPGGSSDFELSNSRVAGFTNELRDDYGVEIVDSPEAVAERCDLLFIESVDGRAHRDLFERTLRYARPTFIDKPFATSLVDARAMVTAASSAGVPLMSCSSLRYASTLRAALADESAGKLIGIDTYGPMALQPTQPGLFWYGIHCIEMMVAALGAGFQPRTASRVGRHELVTAIRNDDRVATFHGVHHGSSRFGAVLHRENGVQLVDASASDPPFLAGLLRVVIESLSSGYSDVPADEMLEVVRIIEAANASIESGEAMQV